MNGRPPCAIEIRRRVSLDLARPRCASPILRRDSGRCNLPLCAIDIRARVASLTGPLLRCAADILARFTDDGRHPCTPSPPSVQLVNGIPSARNCAIQNRSASTRRSRSSQSSTTSMSGRRSASKRFRSQLAFLVDPSIFNTDGIECCFARRRPLLDMPMYRTSRVRGSLRA